MNYQADDVSIPSPSGSYAAQVNRSLDKISKDDLFDSESLRTIKHDPNLDGKCSPLLKLTLLKKISCTIRSFMGPENVNCGPSTCIRSKGNLIAVGTKNGVVLCFNKQALKSCLRHDISVGSVSALSINDDVDRLLAGHSTGYVALWNLSNDSCIRVVNDNHSASSAIIHLSFTSAPGIAIFSDTSGSVFEVSIHKKGKELNSKCIFSGSRGEVLNIEPLAIPSTLRNKLSSLQEFYLLALVTVTKVLIISLFPTITVHYSFPFQKCRTLPLLAWRFVPIQVTSKQLVLDPVLAFTFENQVHFIQAACRSPQNMIFSSLQVFNFKFQIRHLMWLNCKTIAVLDQDETLHILDVRSGEEIDNISLLNEIKYQVNLYDGSNSRDFNISQTMSSLGRNCCNGTICTMEFGSSHSTTASILILSPNYIQLYELKEWSERVDWFVAHQKYESALLAALSFYHNKAKAVIGLEGSRENRRKVVTEKMIFLMDGFLDLTIGKHVQDTESPYVLRVINLCSHLCLAINKPNLIYEMIYEKCCSNPGTHKMFLKTIKFLVLEELLRELHPIIAKDLLNYLTEQNDMKDMENLIVRLPVSCLDIHQTIKICKEKDLYHGLIYIYNETFHDYLSPLTEILSKTYALLSSESISEEKIRIGNSILNYIHCCLSGTKYPGGEELEKSYRPSKREIIKLLIKFKIASDNQIDSTFYPYLRALLRFDTKNFLNMLTLALDSDDFQCDDYNLIDLLIHLMVETEGWSHCQKIFLFVFLIRQYVKPDCKFDLTDKFFDQMIETLAKVVDKSLSEEVQQSLLELSLSDKINQNRKEKLIAAAKC